MTVGQWILMQTKNASGFAITPRACRIDRRCQSFFVAITMITENERSLCTVCRLQRLPDWALSLQHKSRDMQHKLFLPAILHEYSVLVR